MVPLCFDIERQRQVTKDDRAAGIVGDTSKPLYQRTDESG